MSGPATSWIRHRQYFPGDGGTNNKQDTASEEEQRDAGSRRYLWSREKRAAQISPPPQPAERERGKGGKGEEEISRVRGVVPAEDARVEGRERRKKIERVGGRLPLQPAAPLPASLLPLLLPRQSFSGDLFHRDTVRGKMTGRRQRRDRERVRKFRELGLFLAFLVRRRTTSGT